MAAEKQFVILNNSQYSKIMYLFMYIYLFTYILNNMLNVILIMDRDIALRIYESQNK